MKILSYIATAIKHYSFTHPSENNHNIPIQIHFQTDTSVFIVHFSLQKALQLN
eukprot:c56637_g1_i1 orf=57-215(-)